MVMNGTQFEEKNDDKFKAEKYLIVGRLIQIRKNEMTATSMALEDVDWTDQSPNRLEQIDKAPLSPNTAGTGLF